MVQRNNLSSEDRELHNIEDENNENKQVMENCDSDDDDEKSLKQMLNVIEMNDVVKIVTKKNWHVFSKLLQNPELGYEVI